MIAEKTGTDKLDHGYIPLYEKYFKGLKPDWLLEIGAWKGQSLEMWRQFFKGTTIATIENFGYKDCLSKKELEAKSFYVYEGNQGNITFLDSIWEKFGIIIDDGSHFDLDRSIAFRHLFKHNLSSGSIYVIEDLHTSLDRGWQKHDDPKDAMLNAFKKFIKLGTFGSLLFPEDEIQYWKENIAKMELHDDKILFVWKK